MAIIQDDLHQKTMDAYQQPIQRDSADLMIAYMSLHPKQCFIDVKNHLIQNYLKFGRLLIDLSIIIRVRSLLLMYYHTDNSPADVWVKKTSIPTLTRTLLNFSDVHIFLQSIILLDVINDY